MRAIYSKLLLLFFSCSIYASQLNWVDEQIEAIKPPRKGVELIKKEDPFIFLEKNKSEIKKEQNTSSIQTVPSSKISASVDNNISDEKERVFALSVIINGSALIDGVWYRQNDTIENYVVVDITKTTAILKKSDRIKKIEKIVVLSTSTNTPNIKFKNK